MKVSMIPDNSVNTIHASKGDTELRKWKFEPYDNEGIIDISNVQPQLVYPVQVGGTEQILPENTATPTTSNMIADIQYPDELREDQEILYRQMPSTKSGKAKIVDIKGNTIKFNQILKKATWSVPKVDNDITVSNNNDGS